ncbi:MAG: hypothetical protein AMXMBFR57_13850 [Acidimicrobiia bacterium]
MTTESLRPYVPGKWWTPLLVTMVVLPIAAKFAPWPLMSRLLLGGHRAILLSGLAILTIHGFRLRRGTWTFRSWRRFAGSVIVGTSAIVLVFGLASSADSRAWWILMIGRFGLFVLLLSLIIGGPLALMPALWRFACDPLDTQFDSKLARLWRRATGAMYRRT